MSTPRIRSLSYLNKQWVLITEVRPDVESQAVITADEADGFPMDRVKSQWGYGRRIVHVSYGENTWVVLMEQYVTDKVGDVVTNQEVHLSKALPEDEIQRLWRDGLRIVALQPCSNGQWVLVSEKVPGPVVGQSLIMSADPLPSKDIQETWNEDKKIVYFAYDAGSWIIIGEKAPGAGQAYAGNSQWPQAKIDARYAEGMGIGCVAWNTQDEAWAIIFNPKINDQHVIMTAAFPEDQLKKDFAVSRYGKRFY